MDTTIRNLDAKLYRRLRARAVANATTIGHEMNAAMREYLVLPINRTPKRGSILNLPVFDLGPGSERLSEQVDEVLYGEAE